MREAPLPKNSPEILNDWDKKILEEGLANITKQMMKDFDGGLPDAIIYPETSARPLFFAMQPIIRRMCGIKGITEPRSYAFNAVRTPTTLNLAEGFKNDFTNRPDTIDTTDQLADQFNETFKDSPRVAALSIEAGSGEPERMKPWRNAMKERAKEILDREGKLNPSPRVVVVDDFATEQATTANEVRRAFNMPDMHFYALMGQVGAGALTKEVTVGVEVDPFQKETMNPSKSLGSRFTFSHMPEVGVRKGKEAQKRTSKILPSDQLDSVTFLARKKQLQQEMRAIGDRIASKLEKEFKQENQA